MAIWNTIRRGNLKEGLNILAEHYQQERIIAEEKLKSISSKKINQLFSEQTGTVKAHHLSTDWRVFDLPDSLNNFLLGGKDPSIEKVTSNKKVASQDDYIISRLRYYLKETAVVPPSDKKTALSTEYLVYRSKSNLSTHLLLPFALSSYVQAILKWAQTGNAHPRFASSTLNSIYLPDILIKNSDYFEDIISRANDKVKESDNSYTKATKLLEQELVLNDFKKNEGTYNRVFLSEIFQTNRIDAHCFNPELLRYEKWIVQNCKYDKLGYLLKGTLKGHQEDISENGLHPYVSIKDIDNLEIIPSGYCNSSKSAALRNDMLLAITGATIGKVGLVSRNSQLAFSGDLLNLKVDLTKISPFFLITILKSPIGQTQLIRWITGSTNGHLSPFDIGKIIIPRLDPVIEDKISGLIKQSIDTKIEAELLLKQAKTEVETLIENAITNPS